MIVDENVTYANKKYYEILKVKIGHQKLTELEIKYGPINLKNKSEIFVKKYLSIVDNYKRILKDFKGSQEEYTRLNNEINEILEMLK